MQQSMQPKLYLIFINIKQSSSKGATLGFGFYRWKKLE